MFPVIIIIVLVKSTVLPTESVSLPLSSTWRRTSKISGCAFSISSNNTTQYGLLRTLSVSIPPSSYPTYPAGAPISLDTECFSENSDISNLIRAFSSPNKAFASSLQHFVFPTPLVPRKTNEPIGLWPSDKPVLPLLTAFAIALIALSWPITFSDIILSSPDKAFNSELWQASTGIPVRCDVTAAISDAVTVPMLFFS